MKIEEKVRIERDINTFLTTDTENNEILINLDNVAYFEGVGLEKKTKVFFMGGTAPIFIREYFYNIQELLHD